MFFNCCNLVSIPYGTIKSTSGEKNIYYRVKFQFLMVRLKDEQRTLIGFYVKFQFLMVRLKVLWTSLH